MFVGEFALLLSSRMLTPSTAACAASGAASSLKIARFLRATRRVVLRIEIEDQGSAGVVRQAMGLAVLVLERECGSFLAGVDERHL